MATSDKLQDLIDIKQDIKVAIENKGGDLTGVDFGGYAEKIDEISLQKEEQIKIVSPTTSSQDVLPDTNKVLSKVTVNAIPTETKSQQPNLSSGNQVINATSGKFMTSFSITKDTTNHIAGNIRSGKTLYGVTGNLQPEKEEQTKTVSSPNFSSGNVVVTPDSGKVLTQVTVVKDIDLVPENIVKDVNIFGVVGTAETGGGGTSIDRIGIVCFSFHLSKGSSTTQTLSYSISSEMLTKTFFTDGEGNWYLPSDVSVYYRDTYKGRANTSFTLFSGTETYTGYKVTFKVGTTPVALLLYSYMGDDDAFDTVINSVGYIRISWNTGIATIRPNSSQVELIELSGDFFDGFPYYSHPNIRYWRKENHFEFLDSTFHIQSGWELIDYNV